jgi:hypothetical protein
LHTGIVENLVFARNPDRFPGDFASTLVPKELGNTRSQKL